MKPIWLTTILAGLLICCGCGREVAVNQLDDTTPTGLNSASDDGCCGKCAAEIASEQEAKEGCCGKCQSQTVADQSMPKECCGKCATEIATEAKAKEGCCGKCQGEIAQQSTATEGPCAGDCRACAEGDEENCRCQEGSNASEGNTISQDRDIFHHLLQHHEKITRTVTLLENGVKTVTESNDPEIAAKIQEHVASMHQRIENGRPIRMWDELYQAVFQDAEKIEMEIENTTGGVTVIETSKDPAVVKLIQAHAEVVSGFAKHGFDEARKNHQPPQAESAEQED